MAIVEKYDRQALAAQLGNTGYCVLKQAVSEVLLETTEAEFHRLEALANDILATIQGSAMSLGEYYRSDSSRFIVVPEADNADKTCRFEYLSGTSDIFRNEVIPTCQRWIEDLFGHPVKLFKDKCNFKSPGGGAFTAHQDIEAYLSFGPGFHITAALMLDPATTQNGALEFAENYIALQHPAIRHIDTPMGRLPLFPTYQGGAHHGRMVRELEEQLHWVTIYTEPGDVLLFNSYVPHRSAVNGSDTTRRAFFFTFNPACDGDLYEEYYRQKRADYSNPHFHVATPTQRN